MNTLLQEEVLAYIMDQPSLLPNALSVVGEHCFEEPSYKSIYESMSSLRKEGKTIDRVNVQQSLLNKFKGDEDDDGYLTSILSLSQLLDYSIGDYDRFEQKLYDLAYPSWEKRTLEGLPKVFESIAQMEIHPSKKLEQYRQRINARLDTAPVPRKKRNYGDSFLVDLQGAQREAVTTGWPEFDEALGTFEKTQLIYVAGRPAMGKSTAAYNIMNHFLESNDDSVMLFSMEIGGKQVYKRSVSMMSGVRSEDFVEGGLNPADKERFILASKKLAKYETEGRLIIESDDVYSINSIENKIRLAKKKGSVGMIILDYIQLIKAPGNSPYERATVISNELKSIARRYEVIIIGVSQLSRKVEDRADKRPVMSDLRDSGSLEQDADKIIMVYRDDYYHPDREPNNLIDMNIVKNREGANGTVKLHINLVTGKIKEVQNANSK